MSKRTAAITLAGALLLAGCSAPEPIDREAIYLKLVRDNSSNTSTDAELVSLAKAACDALESGASVKDVTYVIATSNLDASEREDVSTIIGFAISQYCPDQA